ncbi:PilT/PilU family type 4a pilus ATPase, partial [Deltaproteobacteria bacterium OttesenSCG-928-K17]|nr:PilT/PilU family type 4a pilus ATPase [Deltaproteobacteria bacterium OttesenSCG-928-K17]
MIQPSHLEYILQKILVTSDNISDINITEGHPFQVEIDGLLTPVYFEPEVEKLTAFQTESIAICLIRSNRRLLRQLLSNGSCDLSYSIAGRARFRVNIFAQQGKFSIVMRRLENHVRTLEELNLPRPFYQMAEEKNGIIFVSGATGSGKSTTLAAILDRINESKPVHVITLEDPVEYLHPAKMATFNQRELGVDFQAFAQGLRAAMRQSPKVILIGEARDRETLEIALAAAETGHLVFATIHASDASSTVSRILGFFDLEEERQIRVRLAGILRWVVTQRLLPKMGGGRVAAMEIMGSSLLIKDLVANGETEEKNFYNAIASMRPMGFQTFDQHILDLYHQKLISEDTARVFSTKKSVVNRGLDTIKAESGEIDGADTKLT